jgi:hypothetical protein
LSLAAFARLVGFSLAPPFLVWLAAGWLSLALRMLPRSMVGLSRVFLFSRLVLLPELVGGRCCLFCGSRCVWRLVVPFHSEPDLCHLDSRLEQVPTQVATD